MKNKQNEQSKIEIQEELQNWDKENSPAFRFFTQKFTKLNKEILLVFARLLSEKLNCHDLSRNHHRSRDLLFKWFDDHWNCCEPILNRTCFVDQNYNLLMKNSPNVSSLLESHLADKTQFDQCGFNQITGVIDQKEESTNPQEEEKNNDVIPFLE